MIKDGDGPHYLVELRPDRGTISLGEIEQALKGSPFSIKREKLEYFSLIRMRVRKIENYQKHLKILTSLDGRNLQSSCDENTDGSLWITLRDSGRNSAIPHNEKWTRTLITHRRLTRYFTENKIELIEIRWGYQPHLDNAKARRIKSGTRPEIWRGDPFGARSSVHNSVAGKQNASSLPSAIPEE